MPQYYTYWIVFHGEYTEESPIIYYDSLNKMRQDMRGTMHLLDANLIPITSAVEFVMNLPRIELDLYNMHEQEIELLYDIPHQIVLVPDSIFVDMRIGDAAEYPTLVLYSANCEFEKEGLEKIMPSALGYFETEELDEKLLRELWGKLGEKSCLEDHEKLNDLKRQYIVNEKYLKALPLLFLARQYKRVEYVLEEVYNSTDVEQCCIGLQYEQLVHQKTLVSLGKNNVMSPKEVRAKYEEYSLEQSKKPLINLVLTVPGVPKVQVKYGGVLNYLPDDEKSVIRNMAIHRAIAQNGVLVEIPCAGQDIFKIVNDLELHCYEANNKYIWRTLRRLGKKINDLWGRHVEWCVYKAKHITVFSDIPIGLGILEGTDVPIHCHKSVSYHPLTPLTRNYQTEMMMNEKYYLGNKCKIIFAECISADDKEIRKTSEQIKTSLEKMKDQYPSVELIYKETLKISELKQLINENLDADILYISAHGRYDRRNNAAGLMIGNEFWMAETNDFVVPPIVLLSACHVSPRGSGSVSVADMFIRLGAKAVLGTLVPVNAVRNSILMNRLFVYIMESQKGSKQYKTLSDAWAGIISSNAIHEMMTSSSGFFDWMMEENEEGVIRLEDFLTKRSVGRLRAETIYSDTIKIVKEMLKEAGLEGKFSDILDQENIYPESFFYQFIGYPEQIILSIDE